MLESTFESVCVLSRSTVSFTCDADRSWRSINDLIVPPLCLPGMASAAPQTACLNDSVTVSTSRIVCGRSLNPVSGHQRIIGGNVAQANSIPWQVLLSISGNRAGGMVIADRWILTAAHVLTSGGSTVLANSVRVSRLHRRRRPSWDRMAYSRLCC